MNVVLIWGLADEIVIYYFHHTMITREEIEKIKESHSHFVGSMIDDETKDYGADWLNNWLEGKDNFKVEGPVEAIGDTVVVVSGQAM